MFCGIFKDNSPSWINIRISFQGHIDAEKFAKDSMMPKVKAAVDFVRQSGKPAIIGDLKDAKEIIAGTQDTMIVNEDIQAEYRSG